MDTRLEQYYASKPEPYQGCLLALRSIITGAHPDIREERKYQVPFFIYRGKTLAYLWLDRKKLKVGFCIDKTLLPVTGIGKHKDRYESFEVNANADLPIEFLHETIREHLARIDNFLDGVAKS